MATPPERRYRLLDQAMAQWSKASQAAAVLFDRRGVPVKGNGNARLAIADVGGDPQWLEARRIPALATEASASDLPAWIRREWLHPITGADVAAARQETGGQETSLAATP